MRIQTPDWVKSAVFYQIFPDRYSKSERTKHPRGIQFKPWGSDPKEQGYQGGDLYGVVDKLDHLVDLGITAIYLNPIFSSASNHRYHAYDYMTVDPLLGGDAALRELLDAAHAKGIKIILDGVFNHASRGFWAFHHILENGGNSPYIDWFTIYGWPLRPYDSDKNNPLNYAAWWDLPALPKLNVSNPGLRDHLMEVAKYWLDFGIDGWRLDVADEIKDDEFWREFRRVCLAANPEAYIVAEIWPFADHWLQGDMFDGVMNYQFTGPTLGFFADNDLSDQHHFSDQNFINFYPHSAEEFKKNITAMYAHYDPEINHANMTMLDSHDTPRALTLLKNNKAMFKQAVLFQMFTPGAPCVYYGDEIGMDGGQDPDCRKAFPWQDPNSWDKDLLTFYKTVISTRKSNHILSRGSLSFLKSEDGIVILQREWEGKSALIAFSNQKVDTKTRLRLDDPRKFKQIFELGNSSWREANGMLELTFGTHGALVLLSEDRE